MVLFQNLSVQTGLPHLSRFKIPWQFPDTTWQNNIFHWQFILFFKVKKTHLIVIKDNSTTYPGFLKDNSLTVLISTPWVYICQADIYINTTQVDSFLYDESFNLKECHNNIPWQFPDIGRLAKIPWHFFKIPWLFPGLEKILFFPYISLARGNPVQIERNFL